MKDWPYKLIKPFADSITRGTLKWLPSLKARETICVVPAVPPFRPALPQNIAQLPPAFTPFFQEEIRLPAIHIATLRQANVSWHTLVFNNFRIFFPALARPLEAQNYQDSYMLKQWVAQPIRPDAEQPIALVFDQWSMLNYYHWLVDSLSRLLVLRTHFPGATLILPEPQPAYMRTSAAILGFHNFLPLQPAQVVQAARLVIPEHVAPVGFQHPVLLPQVREALVAALWGPNPLPAPTRRVYASRARQAKRRIQNDIQGLLERHGFETVFFEDLTLAQQVRLMVETRVFVGLHGANLANALFMQPGSAVVELMNAQQFLLTDEVRFEGLIYFRMCSCLGLPYFALPCQPVPGQVQDNYTDVEVDLAALAHVLEQVKNIP